MEGVYLCLRKPMQLFLLNIVRIVVAEYHWNYFKVKAESMEGSLSFFQRISFVLQKSNAYSPLRASHAPHDLKRPQAPQDHSL